MNTNIIRLTTIYGHNNVIDCSLFLVKTIKIKLLNKIKHTKTYPCFRKIKNVMIKKNLTFIVDVLYNKVSERVCVFMC